MDRVNVNLKRKEKKKRKKKRKMLEKTEKGRVGHVTFLSNGRRLLLITLKNSGHFKG